MGKRFIDTNLFSDDWVQDLSMPGKLFFIYFICNCDHAGIIKVNSKLIEFQTGIKSLDTVIKEFGNSLVRVKEGIYFMPRFIKFQYPGFPKSGVMQQEGALKILESYGLNYLINERVKEDLTKSYDSVSVNDNVNESKNGKVKTDFEKTFDDYLKMRKSIKKPATPKAIELVNRKLSEISLDENIQIEILNQSIRNCWQDVYPIKKTEKELIANYDKIQNGFEQREQNRRDRAAASGSDYGKNSQ